MIIKEEKYIFCTYCDKDVTVTVENTGMPISGDDYRCSFCKRGESDMYEDNKGIEFRIKNPVKWYDESEILTAIEKYSTKFITPTTKSHCLEIDGYGFMKELGL